MDAPVVHSHVEGEGEKQSYMKKMKAKARKLKDTVSAYRHQGQEQQVVHHAPADEHDEVDDVDNEEDDGLTVHDLGIGNVNTNANATDPMKSNVPELNGAAALNSGEARKTDAPPREGGISLDEAPREYDHEVPKETTNLVSSEREELLGGERTNVASTPAIVPVIKDEEEPKEFDAGIQTPCNTPVSSLANEETAGISHADIDAPKLAKTDVLGEETPLPKSSLSYLAQETDKNSNDDIEPEQTFVSDQRGHRLDESMVNLDQPKEVEEVDHAPMTNLDQLRGLEEDVQAPKSTFEQPREVEEVDHAAKAKLEQPSEVEEVDHALHAPKANLDQPRGVEEDDYVTKENLDQPMEVEQDVQAPKAILEQSREVEEDVQAPESFLDQPREVEEDDHALEANSQADTPDFDTKIPDQIKSGDEETEVTAVLHSFDEMNINAENDQRLDNGANKNISTESHDQLSPVSPSKNSPSYLSSATSAIANSAISAKNAFAYRLGYGATNSADHVTDAETPRDTIQPDHNTEPAVNSPTKSGTTYTEKLSSATYAIPGGAISAKNAVGSKLGYGSKEQVHDNVDVETTRELNGGDISTNEVVKEGEKGKGVAVKDYIVEKLSPGEEDKALSEVLSEKLKILKPGAKGEAGESARPSPVGKVTESEEVKQRLENAEGNDNFVVKKIEDKVGSMLGGTN